MKNKTWQEEPEYTEEFEKWFSQFRFNSSTSLYWSKRFAWKAWEYLKNGN